MEPFQRLGDSRSGSPDVFRDSELHSILYASHDHNEVLVRNLYFLEGASAVQGLLLPTTQGYWKNAGSAFRRLFPHDIASKTVDIT
jgi:hypothetical protein